MTSTSIIFPVIIEYHLISRSTRLTRPTHINDQSPSPPRATIFRCFCYSRSDILLNFLPKRLLCVLWVIIIIPSFVREENETKSQAERRDCGERFIIFTPPTPTRRGGHTKFEWLYNIYCFRNIIKRRLNISQTVSWPWSVYSLSVWWCVVKQYCQTSSNNFFIWR